MSALPRLLVLDDNPDFGGHQVMTRYALEGLVAEGKWEIHGWLDPDNQRNRAAWESIAASAPERFSITPCPTRTRKFQALRNRVNHTPLHALRAAIDRLKPNLILAIQGNIEHSCSVLALAGQLPCPLVSYIPLPHGHAEMGAKLGRLRDLTCRSLYAAPDGFITISPTLAEALREKGARGRLQVVENGIPLEPLREAPSKAEARAELELPEDAFIWGQVGRIEFKQKGQDFALGAFRAYRAHHPERSDSLVFVGSGPDEETLRMRLESIPDARLLPWRQDLRAVYAALDALLLPSRYEGVPLVMLEALAVGCPVLATDRDGMRDWLPEAWRFPYRDPAALAAAMGTLGTESRIIVESLRQRIWAENSIFAFQKAFNRAIEEWKH